ncbi:MAG: hypothetical protein K1000chlam4_00731 [Chlamydiae bacterium]|nr:hypothetical protein [Chlamydiota bacterium]
MDQFRLSRLTKMISRSLGVHDGTFHADEVTACALLILFDLIDEDKIIRTRDSAKLANCEYVCDVGGLYDPLKKLFDHHQSDYQGKLSSAGMILLYLKEKKILTVEEYAFFNNMLIIGIDDHDNGRSPQLLGYCTFSHVIAGLTPIHYDATDEEQTEAFFLAVRFALGHLKRLLGRYKYTVDCRKEVAVAMKKYRTCLYFDRALPWLENFFALTGATAAYAVNVVQNNCTEMGIVGTEGVSLPHYLEGVSPNVRESTEPFVELCQAFQIPVGR